MVRMPGLQVLVDVRAAISLLPQVFRSRATAVSTAASSTHGKDHARLELSASCVRSFDATPQGRSYRAQASPTLRTQRAPAALGFSPKW